MGKYLRHPHSVKLWKCLTDEICTNNLETVNEPMENLRVRPTILPKALHIVLTSPGTDNFQFQDFVHLEYHTVSLGNRFLIFQVNAVASSLRDCMSKKMGYSLVTKRTD